jgi:Ca-activated chloride channel family protein
MTSQGSDLPSGLEAALESFPSGVESERFLFLFSDGENFGDELGPVVENARERGIMIITIGAGEVEGARIPLGDGDYLRDAEGETVLTRLHPANLRFLSEETEGEYLSLNDPGLMRKIDALYGTSAIRYNEPRESAYHPYLLGALASLLLYFLIRIVRWKNAF